MNLQATCHDVIEIVKNAGDFISGERKKNIQNKVKNKGKHNYVTYVDTQSEEMLVKNLGKLIPGSGFIAEEGTTDKQSDEYNWIIDPLDGTTNFIHGAPPYSVSVALQYKNEMIMGVVYEITMKECFYAFNGGKSFLNGKEIHVSETEKVSDSLIATGFPYHNFDRLAPFMESLDLFFNHSHGVRRLGSAAADLSYVACGRYDAFYEYNLNPWDVAAGAFIIRQAGGKVSDFKGGNDFIFGKEIIAANGKIFNEFKTMISNIFNK